MERTFFEVQAYTRVLARKRKSRICLLRLASNFMPSMELTNLVFVASINGICSDVLYKCTSLSGTAFYLVPEHVGRHSPFILSVAMTKFAWGRHLSIPQAPLILRTIQYDSIRQEKKKYEWYTFA